jgi:hypothetical protein
VSTTGSSTAAVGAEGGAGGNGGGPGGNGGSALKTYAGVVVALLALVAYVIFVSVMWDKVGDTGNRWERRLLLFDGVELIVFAGVGWLFGREVNRRQADSAEQAQNAAQANAATAAAEHERGQALAAAVRTSAGEDGALADVTGASAARSQMNSLVALADELYPASAP